MNAAPDAFSVDSGTTVAAVLRHPPLDQVDARALLCYGLQLSRVQLITQSERTLTAEEADRLTHLFRRRLNGEPVAYILGEREFFGLMLKTTPDVLIPRPETELLVELALDRLPQGGRLLDMGTGSGAIALAVAHARNDVVVTALDASEAALEVALGNAMRHRLDVQFLLSDWYAVVGQDRFELIASNPPYIREGDIHLSQGDLRFEPVDALTDHADGLSALRMIIDGAPEHLAMGGWLLVEHGFDQALDVRKLLAARGFADVQSWRDLAGIERVSGGRHGI